MTFLGIYLLLGVVVVSASGPAWFVQQLFGIILWPLIVLDWCLDG